MNAKEIILAGGRKTHSKPVENYAVSCYDYHV